MITEKHLDYCTTTRQTESVAAIIEHAGDISKASKAISMAPNNLRRTISILEKRAAKSGWSPDHSMTKEVAPGFGVKRVSTLFDKDGSQKLQWVISSPDAQQQLEAMESAARVLSEDIKPAKKIKAPKSSNKNLLAQYTISDAHVGMLAWGRENLESDWDLSIAERVLTGVFEEMVRQSPAAEEAVVCQIGDFLYFDGLEAVTPTHGHLLDADGRFGKVVEVAIRILRRVVDMALEKHQKVTVIMAEGNHDLASSVWLRKMFSALYEKEPRVTVCDSELPYYVHVFGDVMLGFHHGHKKQPAAFPLFFAAQFPKQWGETIFRYSHCGHRHHQQVKEHAGMIVIQHATAASRDAHASRGGYIALRRVLCHVYHKKHGLVSTTEVSPEMVG